MSSRRLTLTPPIFLRVSSDMTVWPHRIFRTHSESQEEWENRTALQKFNTTLRTFSTDPWVSTNCTWLARSANGATTRRRLTRCTSAEAVLILEAAWLEPPADWVLFMLWNTFRRVYSGCPYLLCLVFFSESRLFSTKSRSEVLACHNQSFFSFFSKNLRFLLFCLCSWLTFRNRQFSEWVIAIYFKRWYNAELVFRSIHFFSSSSPPAAPAIKKFLIPF